MKTESSLVQGPRQHHLGLGIGRRLNMRRLDVGKPLLAIIVLCGLVASVVGTAYGNYGGYGKGYGGYGGYGWNSGYGGYGGNMYGTFGGYGRGYGGYNYGKGTAMYIPYGVPVPSVPYTGGNYGNYDDGILPIILFGGGILLLLFLLDND